jgi:hypothetical protein
MVEGGKSIAWAHTATTGLVGGTAVATTAVLQAIRHDGKPFGNASCASTAFFDVV